MFLYSKKPHIVLLSETWLTAKIVPRFINYKYYRKDRSNNGGGLMILLRQDLEGVPVELKAFNNGVLEYQTMEIQLKNEKIKIFNCYNPNKNLRPKEIIHYIQQLGRVYIIGGDFNAHHGVWSSAEIKNNSSGNSLVEILLVDPNLVLLTPCGLPTYRCPRNYGESTLDLTFTSGNISDKFSVALGPYLGSDHVPVIIESSLEINKITKKCLPKWNVKAVDWKAWKDLLETRKPNFPEDVENFNERFTEELKEVSSKLIKVKTGSNQIKYNKPWWSEECSKAVALTRRAFNVVKNNPTGDNRSNFRKLEAKKKKIILKTKRESWKVYCSQLTDSSPVSKVWETIRKIKGTYRESAYPIQSTRILTDFAKAEKFAESILPNSINAPRRNKEGDVVSLLSSSGESIEDSVVQEEKEGYNTRFTVNELQTTIDQLKVKTQSGIDNIPYIFLKNLNANFFHGLLALINLSWRRHTLPSTWKEAIILPILKMGKDPSNITSYRPISLLSTIGKVMEKLVNNRLTWVLESQQKLGSFQYGFRRGRSTMDHLLILENEIRRGLMGKEIVISLFVDLKSAYDTVNHEELIKKIRELGISGRMFYWLSDFLRNRTFKVVVNGTLSNKKEMTTGTPQGSILSPLLFNIAVCDLPDSPNTIKLAFADDLSYHYRGKDIEEGIKAIQDAINQLEAFTKIMGFIINPEKSKIMIFTRKRICLEKITNVYMGTTKIPFVTEHTVLGMTLDSPRLTWGKHIKKLKTDCLSRLQTLKAVSGTSWGADRKTLKIFYNSFVLSKLNYGSILYESA
ncbi:unnamed protein product, partial [Rotaria magnacalcarata]